MKEVAQNTYIGGINRDKSKHLPNKDTMWDNKNFRVLTQEGDSSLALVNVKGNAEIFDNTGSTQLSTEDGYSIIGHGVLRNDIILFAVKDDGDITNGILPTKSRIYLYKWDNVNNEFYPRITLYEDNSNNAVTGLRLQNEIDTITRWETNYIQKVYWTDGVNNVRYVNISPDVDDITGLPKEGTDASHYTRVDKMDTEDFDIVQKMDLPKPSFKGYASGELYAGMIQFNYRFYNIHGGESMFGQASDLVPIFSDSHTNSSASIRGDVVNTNCKKTVKGSLYISGDNLLFDRVELVSLHYSSLKGVPTINVIDIQKIEGDVPYTINFEDTGTDYLDSITLSEYRNIKNDYIAKTFDTKDDRMFIGNIKERYFNVEGYDARAYRYNDSNSCIIYDRFGTDLVVTPSTYVDVPADHDCINLYKNDLSYDEAVSLNTALDFKYDENGQLGGSGLNISYTFGTKDYDNGSGGSEVQASFNYDENDYPWQIGMHKGFQHDEIYRFGIVFFDNKGRQSFVNWIADIRMPRHNEYQAMKSIYPVFSFNRALPTNTDGTPYDYQFLYVKREQKDRTVLASGMVVGTIADTFGSEGATYRVVENKTRAKLTADPAPVPQILTGIGTGRNNCLFYSPDIDYNDLSLADTYLEQATYYNHVANNTVLGDNSAGENKDRFAGVIKHTVSSGVVLKRFKITYTKTLNTEAYLLTNNPGKGEPVGRKVMLNDGNIFVMSTQSEASFAVADVVSVLADALYIQIDTHSSYLSDNCVIRRSIKGYGGDTHIDRQQNTYISAGSINANECIYGDTYVGYHSRQITGIGQLYNTGGEAGDILSLNRSDSNENSGSVIDLLFPVETSVVLPLTSGDTLNRNSKNEDSRLFWLYGNSKSITGHTDSASDYIKQLDYEDSHIYNPVYSMVHTDKIYFPKPLDWQKQVHFDTRIRWSNPKINGEERDSWLMFLANNIQDVDNRYGSLNQLVNFKNNLFAFQESGFCVLPVNERAITTGTTGSAVSLGEGSVLPKHMNYAAGSTVVGIQNNNKVIQSLRAMYWVDVNKRKFYRFAGTVDSLSDVKGLSAYFAENVNDNTTFKGSYNNRYAEVMLTMNNTTLVLNEMIDAFQGWFTLTPVRYIKTPVKFLTTPNNKGLWEHDIGNYGSWYGNIFYSIISLIVNSNGSITKEYNNVQYMSESYNEVGEDNYYDTLNTIKGENDYQMTETVDLLPYNNGDTLYVGGLQIPDTAPSTVKNIRRRERIWNTTVPRIKLINAGRDNPRLRDAYAKLTFEYFNADNFKFVVHNIITFFRNASKT